ncbi:PKD domain-containing protein [Vicingaceae bacterium]|nr:PKD domain-containing protein [Vicingaceae bacterium]MDB4062007.1 PKD domain-containing protein [Vicingaceae bacterium]MDC1452119.1 PKD domain-containing protein [Vicingaceae bacterium]
MVNTTVSNDSIIRYQYVLDKIDTFRLREPKFGRKEAGNYRLELLVEPDKSCTDTTSRINVINEKLNVAFEVLNNNTVIPFSVDIKNNTTNASTYFWSSGDGATSNKLVPSFNYMHSCTYRLNLTATSIVGCSDSIKQQLNVLMKYIDANLLKVFLTENALGDI